MYLRFRTSGGRTDSYFYYQYLYKRITGPRLQCSIESYFINLSTFLLIKVYPSLIANHFIINQVHTQLNSRVQTSLNLAPESVFQESWRIFMAKQGFCLQTASALRAGRASRPPEQQWQTESVPGRSCLTLDPGKTHLNPGPCSLTSLVIVRVSGLTGIRTGLKV